MIRFLLKERLAEKGWSQADLARKTGIRPGTINEYYNELADRVNLEYLELICNALECDLCDIITMHYKELKEAEAAARRQHWNKNRKANAP